MHNFKELKVWQKSVDLAVEIYQLTIKLPQEEKFGLISQLRRSTVSISSNIAEGAGRKSKKDFHHFLSNALASSFESETQLEICRRLNFISTEEHKLIIQNLDEVQRMIHGLQKSLIET